MTGAGPGRAACEYPGLSNEEVTEYGLDQPIAEEAGAPAGTPGSN